MVRSGPNDKAVNPMPSSSASRNIRISRDVDGPASGEHLNMRIKQASVLLTSMIALAASPLAGCTFEQILIGQWYTIDTPPAGACPALEWRFVVNAQRSIGGSLFRGGQQPIAKLSGVLNPDDSFRITVTELAGGRTADVTGQFTSQVSTISIHGTAAGSECDGQTFKLRLGGYFRTQGGGGGGGVG